MWSTAPEAHTHRHATCSSVAPHYRMPRRTSAHTDPILRAVPPVHLTLAPFRQSPDTLLSASHAAGKSQPVFVNCRPIKHMSTTGSAGFAFFDTSTYIQSMILPARCSIDCCCASVVQGVQVLLNTFPRVRQRQLLDLALQSLHPVPCGTASMQRHHLTFYRLSEP
ncbi:hypothetical protein C8R47DRAFT_1164889, partial [Mycena vitilis]